MIKKWWHHKWARRGFISALLLIAGLSVGTYQTLAQHTIYVPADNDDINHVSFIAMGDQGSGAVPQWQVAKSVEAVAEKAGELNFVALLGDNFYGAGVQSADDMQWQYKFENVYTGKYLSAVPFFAILGNHDYLGDPEAEIQYAQQHRGSNRWRMPAHYYSVDYGSDGGRPLLRIVFIDTNLDGSALTDEIHFVEQQFSPSAHSPLWRMVAGHHPIRNYGKHGETLRLVADLLPVLQQRYVDIYLSGHDHDQQIITRDNEPLYLISGAGGKEPYSISKGHQDLLFAAEKNGFAKIDLDATTLKMTYYDSDAQAEAGFVWQRNCHGFSASCLKRQTILPSP